MGIMEIIKEIMGTIKATLTMDIMEMAATIIVEVEIITTVNRMVKIVVAMGIIIKQDTIITMEHHRVITIIIHKDMVIMAQTAITIISKAKAIINLVIMAQTTTIMVATTMVAIIKTNRKNLLEDENLMNEKTKQNKTKKKFDKSPW